MGEQVGGGARPEVGVVDQDHAGVGRSGCRNSAATSSTRRLRKSSPRPGLRRSGIGRPRGSPSRGSQGGAGARRADPPGRGGPRPRWGRCHWVSPVRSRSRPQVRRGTAWPRRTRRTAPARTVTSSRPARRAPRSAATCRYRGRRELAPRGSFAGSRSRSRRSREHSHLVAFGPSAGSLRPGRTAAQGLDLRDDRPQGQRPGRVCSCPWP